MNTRSVVSISESGLGASAVPGGGAVAFDGTATRTGAYDDMCSHIVDEPGPPFHTNVTGRVRALSPSAVYATENTRAISSLFASRSAVVPARAVYAIARPPIVTVWCVPAGGGSAAAVAGVRVANP